MLSNASRYFQDYSILREWTVLLFQRNIDDAGQHRRKDSPFTREWAGLTISSSHMRWTNEGFRSMIQRAFPVSIFHSVGSNRRGRQRRSRIIEATTGTGPVLIGPGAQPQTGSTRLYFRPSEKSTPRRRRLLLPRICRLMVKLSLHWRGT